MLILRYLQLQKQLVSQSFWHTYELRTFVNHDLRGFLDDIRIREYTYSLDHEIETVLFREHHGRYLGYYLDRQSEEIQQAEKDGWNGIEWNVLWQSRDETLDSRLAIRNATINKEKFTSYVRSGRIDRLEWMFSDETSVQQGLEALW